MRLRVAFPLAFAIVAAALAAGSAQAVAPAASVAPAATTPKPNWLPADKQGFGISRTLASKVWSPLAWSHAQFIRLAWSIATGRPVEQPSVVACRYVRKCG